MFLFNSWDILLCFWHIDIILLLDCIRLVLPKPRRGWVQEALMPLTEELSFSFLCRRWVWLLLVLRMRCLISLQYWISLRVRVLQFSLFLFQNLSIILSYGTICLDCSDLISSSLFLLTFNIRSSHSDSKVLFLGALNSLNCSMKRLPFRVEASLLVTLFGVKCLFKPCSFKFKTPNYSIHLFFCLLTLCSYSSHHLR